MSAAFGMAKFLKVGPCRLLPYERINFGLFVVLLNIATCLVGKGVSMFNIEFGRKDCSETIQTNYSKSNAYRLNAIVFSWIGINILPQMIFVSIF